MKPFSTFLFQLTFLLMFGAACSRTQETTHFTKKLENSMSGTPVTVSSWTDTTLQLYSTIQLIFEDSKGNLWFGTQGQGVCKYDGTLYTYFRELDGWLFDHTILSIQEDQLNNIWIQSSAALYQYNGIAFTRFPLENRMQTPEALRAQQQSSTKRKTLSNSLWFRAGADGQVVQLENEEFTRFSIPKPQHNNTEEETSYNPYWVFSLLQDKNENLWFGTLSGGLVRYSGKQFAYLSKETSNATIVSLLEDSKGNIWAGNTNGEIFVYNKNGLNHFTEQQRAMLDHKGSPCAIWTIEEDAQGNIWFGTEGSGAWKYNGSDMTQYTQEQGLPDTHVLSIHQDTKGTLWFGTAAGAVLTFKENIFTLKNVGYEIGGC